MIKSKKKLHYILLFILFLIVCVITVFIVIKNNYNLVEDELFVLESTITEDELKQMGYIDTTIIHQAENEEIKNFLRCAQNHQEAILKTFLIEEGELYAKIFYSDPEWREIRSWAFSPRRQGIAAPDKRFFNAYNDEKDNIVTVILENKKNDSWPTDNQIIVDEILYSYYK